MELFAAASCLGVESGIRRVFHGGIIETQHRNGLTMRKWMPKHCLKSLGDLMVPEKKQVDDETSFLQPQVTAFPSELHLPMTEILPKQCFSLMAREWDSTFRNIYEANEFQISIGSDALRHLFDHLGKSCFEFGPFCSDRVASPTLERSRPLLLQL